MVFLIHVVIRGRVDPVHRDAGFQQLLQPACMVFVGMGQDDPVQPGDSLLLQDGCQLLNAVARSRIHQVCRIAAPEQVRVRLADVN